MSAEVFLDTNILVYTFDHSDPGKRKIASALADPRSERWGVSWQVIQEFCSVALHRFKVPMAASDLVEYLELVLLPHCRVHSSNEVFSQAVEIHHRTQYRFYDSLVIASAIHSGASILYSEDLQHGRILGGLEIRNPFNSP
jgi:predicted nucleic acid-binding protein